MKSAGILLAAILLGSVGVTAAMAECQIADAKLEEAIMNKPDLRGPANTQIVRDLRNLRDAAFTLWSYGRHDDCERLLANIRELLAGPPWAIWETMTRRPLTSRSPHASQSFNAAAPSRAAVVGRMPSP
jgi:hypothetical protein